MTALAFGQEQLTPEDTYQQAMAFFAGDGVARDVDQAARLAKTAAKQGYAPAQSLFGYLHAQGEGARQSWSRAAYWWKLAAEQEYPLAMYNLATLYQTGLGVEKDLAKAWTLYQRLAEFKGESNHSWTDYDLLEEIVTESAWQLGRFYHEDWGVDKDLKEAARWMEVAAVGGSYAAMLQTGLNYALGEGLEADPIKADLYFNMAMNQGRDRMEAEARTFFLEGVKDESLYNEEIADIREERAEAVAFLQTTCGVRLFQEAEKDRPELFATAKHWLALGAERDLPTAKTYLGLLRLFGFAGEENAEAGAALLEEAAFKEVALAQYNVATLLQTGRGIQADPERASAYFLRAGRFSLYPALLAAEDPTQAQAGTPAMLLERTRLAAEQGDELAKACLARAYLVGFGMEADLQEGEQRLLALAEAGNTEAQFALGSAYRLGVLGEMEEQKALKWLESAAQAGHLWAKYEAGILLKSGSEMSIGDSLLGATVVGLLFLEGAEKNRQTQAATYLQECLEAGISDARVPLALMYSSGKGVEADWKVSQRLLNEAVEDGSEAAQSLLGLFYYLGIDGFPTDYTLALEHLERASKRKDVLACYFMGEAYDEGKGVKKDLKKAAEFYRTSAKGGDRDASYRLGEMFKKGEGVLRDYEAAARWLQHAAARGHLMAYFHLNELYEFGYGVEKDEARAYEAYRKLANMGVGGWIKLAHLRCELFKKGGAKTVLSRIAAGLKRLMREDLDNPTVAAYLGICYFRWAHAKRKPSAKYLKLSQEWFEKSLALGSVVGKTELAKLHLEGRWKDASAGLAWQLLQEAAEEGYGEAAYLLAKANLDGEASNKTRQECLELLEMAVDAQVEGAEDLLDELQSELSPAVPTYSAGGTPS